MEELVCFHFAKLIVGLPDREGPLIKSCLLLIIYNMFKLSILDLDFGFS